MVDGPRNIGASVRARLLAIAKERNQPFELLLTRYVLERLLYRLSTTPHRERFVLKGAMLLTTWVADPFRATRDIDLLGFIRVLHAAGYTGAVDLEVIGAKAYSVTQCAIIAAEARGHMQACLQACGAR